MSISYETFPEISSDKSKPSFIKRIKELLQSLALLFLSFIILVFALSISLFASSWLGVIFAAQETVRYIKGLFQKEKCFSSLLSLLSIGTFAYTDWLLGLILCTAIFSSPIAAIIATSIFLGWTLGLTALIIKCVPKIVACFFNKSDINTNNLLEENTVSLSFTRSPYALRRIKENSEQNFAPSEPLLSLTPEPSSSSHGGETVRPGFR